MDSSVKILKLLLSRKEEKFTIKKIAEALKMNYRIAYENAISLEKQGLLKIIKIGNSKVCEFSYKFNSKVYEAEFCLRGELFKKNKDFLILYNRLAELDFPFIALLFGSHAKGTANRHSDIDILTIGGNEKEIRATISLLPDKIHLTSITAKSFVDMAKSNQFTVVSEALRKNVILIGVEEYYRLLSHAR